MDHMPVQRCTVHKHRNLLAHAPDRLHDELSADYKDMIYADSKSEIEAKRKAFICKWRLKCRAVADSLEEAGRLYARRSDLCVSFLRRLANSGQAFRKQRGTVRPFEARPK
jgi:Transposase, Mutator family